MSVENAGLMMAILAYVLIVWLSVAIMVRMHVKQKKARLEREEARHRRAMGQPDTSAHVAINQIGARLNAAIVEIEHAERIARELAKSGEVGP